MEKLQVNGKTYHLLRLLGKGKGGYSYLVENGEGERFTLKQIHHEPCDYYQFGDKMAAELGDYKRLRNAAIPMPRLLDADIDRERILKEYISGESIYEKVLADRMEEAYFIQMRDICQKAYAAGLNIDYFPTNFIVRDGELIYIDYECNLYDPKWDFENWGIQYWRKTPELLSYAAEKGDSYEIHR